MATNSKISALNELLVLEDTDELAVVDNSVSPAETKRILPPAIKTNMQRGFLSLERTAETISGGIITASSSFIDVDTEGAAATDDLDTINGFSNGNILIIHPASSARTVVAKDGTGNLLLAGDFSMDHASDTLTLIYWDLNNYWLEISRSNNA